jgi:hypothetical protein
VLGVGTDQEVRQDAIAFAPCLAIRRVDQAGREAVVRGERHDADLAPAQPPVELPAIPGRRCQFAVDDRRYDQASFFVGPEQERFGAAACMGSFTSRSRRIAESTAVIIARASPRCTGRRSGAS